MTKRLPEKTRPRGPDRDHELSRDAAGSSVSAGWSGWILKNSTDITREPLKPMSKRFARTIEDLAKGIGAGSFRSEAEISQGVVKRVLHELGWPVFDVQVVAPEFKIGTRKVDYALCHPAGKPSVLVEVKDLGKADNRGQKQLFEYCFHQGVPIAVLTDGRDWSFFLPSGQGSYDERRFARLDLIDDASTYAAETCERYLNFDRVKSGEARRRAERDYEEFRRQKEAASNYAAVWRRLLAGPNPLLLDLFSEEVGNETGVRPEPESAARFIRHQAGATVASQGKSTRKRTTRREVASVPAPMGSENPPSLTFRGEIETFKTGAEVLVAVFEKLASLDPDFCRRYSEQHRGKVRRYVAKNRVLLYPGSPRPPSASHRLPGGWFLATHCSNRSKVTRITKACGVGGLTTANITAGNTLKSYRTARSAFPAAEPCLIAAPSNSRYATTKRREKDRYDDTVGQWCFTVARWRPT